MHRSVQINFISFLILIIVSSFATFANAGFEEGQQAYAGGDYVEAFREWKVLADNGHASSQRLIANMYVSGQGVLPDIDQALVYYKKAAAQEDLEAQLALGNMYRQGLSVEKDYAEAVKWLYKAAEGGNAIAQFDLAEIFFVGEGGVQRSKGHAFEWYRLSAKNGVILAQLKLGQLLLEGIAAPRDELTGFMWLTVAAQLVRSETVPPISERVFPRNSKVETDPQKRTLGEIVIAIAADYEAKLPIDLVDEAKRRAMNYDPRTL